MKIDLLFSGSFLETYNYKTSFAMASGVSASSTACTSNTGPDLDHTLSTAAMQHEMVDANHAMVLGPASRA